METKEAQELRVMLNDVLLKNGEANQLKQMLTKLLIDCGWKEEVNLMCRKVITEKGVDNVNLEQIVKEVTPAARAKVPAEIKQILLEKIKGALMKEIADREKENNGGQ